MGNVSSGRYYDSYKCSKILNRIANNPQTNAHSVREGKTRTVQIQANQTETKRLSFAILLARFVVDIKIKQL